MTRINKTRHKGTTASVFPMNGHHADVTTSNHAVSTNIAAATRTGHINEQEGRNRGATRTAGTHKKKQNSGNSKRPSSGLTLDIPSCSTDETAGTSTPVTPPQVVQEMEDNDWTKYTRLSAAEENILLELCRGKNSRLIAFIKRVSGGKSLLRLAHRRDERGFTALHRIIEKGSCEAVQLILEKTDIDINDSENELGATPLNFACSAGRSDIARFLVAQSKVSVVTCDRRGYTPLHNAASNNLVDVITALVEMYGVNPNIVTLENVTALHVACEYGHESAVHKLIELGADLQAVSSTGETILHVAASSGQLSIVDCLVLRYGFNLYRRDNTGALPLHRAGQKGKFQVVKHLLNKYRMDPLVADEDGDNVLHFMCDCGDASSVRKLIKDFGIPPDVETKHGSTPLMIACEKGHVFTVQFLLANCNVDVDKRDKDGDTALHCAVREGHVQIVKLLLERNANPYLQNNKKRTSLNEAKRKHHNDILNVLKTHSQKKRLGRKKAPQDINNGVISDSIPAERIVDSESDSEDNITEIKEPVNCEAGNNVEHASRRPVPQGTIPATQVSISKTVNSPTAATKYSHEHLTTENSEGRQFEGKGKPAGRTAAKPAATGRRINPERGQSSDAHTEREERDDIEIGSIDSIRNTQRAESTVVNTMNRNSTRNNVKPACELRNGSETHPEESTLQKNKRAKIKHRKVPATTSNAVNCTVSSGDTSTQGVPTSSSTDSSRILRDKLKSLADTMTQATLESECPRFCRCFHTRKIMTDPVVACDGYSYQREEIVKWLETHETSPVTGQLLANNMLFPNHQLRLQIMQWVEEKLAEVKGQGRNSRFFTTTTNTCASSSH